MFAHHCTNPCKYTDFFEIHSPEFWRQKQRRHLYTYFKPSHVLSLFPRILSDMTIAAVPVENGKVT